MTDRTLRVAIWPLAKIANAYWPLVFERVAAMGVETVEFGVSAALRERFDVIHVHFPDKPFARRSLAVTLLRLAGTLAALSGARARGAAIVWTAHNLQSHERLHPRLERAFMRWFTRRVDLLIGLTEAGVEAARAAHPALREVESVVAPHPHYKGAYLDAPISKIGARRALAIAEEGRLALMIGQIRAYKNAPGLARAFRAAAPTGWRLAIVGKPQNRKLASLVRNAAGGAPEIELLLDFVPDDRLHLWLRAADLVILPYLDIVNSGAALLALSFDRPVAVTDRPALRELERMVGPQWVLRFDTLDRAALQRALDWAKAERGGAPELSALDPDAIARLHVEAYHRSSARRAGR